MNRKLNQALIPALIIVGGAGLAAMMGVFSPKAARKPPQATLPTVATRPVAPENHRAVVRGSGVVESAQTVPLVPQVSGRILWTSDKLVPGGKFTRGETLARIDPRDYTTALKQAQARLAQAELNLSLEKNRQATAEREWRLLHGPNKPAPDIALRRPHLAATQSDFEAARAAMEKAQLDVERTRLTAPFNAVVLEETIDVGSVVGPGAPVATLAGTDTGRVAVAIAMSDLALIAGGNDQEPDITVVQTTDVQTTKTTPSIVRRGKLLQGPSQLDPQTRKARLMIAVLDPYGSPGDLPMLPGAYVNVTILGKSEPGVLKVPRASLKDGNTLWHVRDGTLLSSTVRVLWSDTGHHYIRLDVHPNKKQPSPLNVLASPLSTPIKGMKVKATSESNPEPEKDNTDAVNSPPQQAQMKP